jgi:SAM-dependent methyltransferase
MSNRKLEMPEPTFKHLIPTLNNTGFMAEVLDYYSEKFVSYSATINEKVLDIGCAYGIATLAALERGAIVYACDMDERHIEILILKTPENLKAQLETIVGILPTIDFPENSFGAILCSRVVHFMRGEDVEASVAKMYHWLKPDGKLFLSADTPYTGFWFEEAPAYERRKREGHKWPGLIEDMSIFFAGLEGPEDFPEFINPMDPDILKRVCDEVGFTVVEMGFVDRQGTEKGSKQHAGVIAVKPA